jgi:hypothetical protein
MGWGLFLLILFRTDFVSSSETCVSQNRGWQKAAFRFFFSEGVVVLQVGEGASDGENCKVISETGIMHL